MTSVAVVIPYLSMRWCLEDCLESFGESYDEVLVVDNSGGELEGGHAFGALREQLPGLHVSTFTENVGIAAAWNEGLALGADQTIICSQFVRLAPAELPRRTRPWGLELLAAGVRKWATPYGLTFSDQGFHLISIGRALVDAIGTFDENFLAYGEDDDYRHRMILAGDLQMGGWAGRPDFFSIGYGVQKRIAGAISGRPPRMLSYWRHKWGSEGGGEIGYRTPFGNPDHPLSYWPPVR